MSEPTSHESLYELLPWYVNGTLADSERRLVEAHVHACLTCHLELKKERRLQEFVQATSTVDLSPEAGFHRLSLSLDNRADSRSRQFWRRFAGRWANFRMTPRLALATCSLAAVAVLLWSTTPRPLTPQAPGYVTLTGNPVAENHVDMIFAGHVTEAEMRALLGEINGSIVAGPTEIGRYTVHLETAALGGEGLTDFIRVMSTDDRVRFVGPATLREPDE